MNSMKNNKVILLTGASSGIGYDTAVALAQQGHKVYAAARRVDRMEPLRQYGIVFFHWLLPTRWWDAFPGSSQPLHPPKPRHFRVRD